MALVGFQVLLLLRMRLALLRAKGHLLAVAIRTMRGRVIAVVRNLNLRGGCHAGVEVWYSVLVFPVLDSSPSSGSLAHLPRKSV